MPKAVIGDNCTIGQNVFIANGVVLGNNVKVQNNVSIYEGVICHNDVFIGPSVVFTNVINPRSAIERKTEYRATIIGKGASIGANATLICGHQVGSFAFIGAGSVVTKEVQSYALVVGNPAIFVAWMCACGTKLSLKTEGHYSCSQCTSEYKFDQADQKLKPIFL